MEVKEVLCSSLLNKSYLADYCVNPYIGCEHGCVYCYARFMRKYTNHKEEWGRFVDVKINAARILKKELMAKAKGNVYISSVTDPYQQLEKKYGLTRKVLEILLKHQFPVSIQTKSSLIKRDIDILKSFDEIDVGFTITVLDDKIRSRFEPFSSSIKERIAALNLMKENGIPTYVFIGPFLPILSERGLEELLHSISFVDYIFIDKLNIKYGNWLDIKRTMKKYYPELLDRWNEILFNNMSNRRYYSMVKERISKICKEIGLETRFVY